MGGNLSTEDQSRKYLPIADWLFHYQKDWLRPDLIAGLTAAAVVIPKAMAYATIAGLPVQVGLYTVLVPMVIYAAMGTSRPLSVSTTRYGARARNDALQSRAGCSRLSGADSGSVSNRLTVVISSTAKVNRVFD